MSSSRLATLDGVSKRYLLGQGRGAGGVLLDLLGRRNARRDIWALRDVSFELRRGEAVGLVGRNGAGKTTALRLLAGISRPSRGWVTTADRRDHALALGGRTRPRDLFVCGGGGWRAWCRACCW